MDDYWGKGILLPSYPDIRSSIPFEKVLATIAEQARSSSETENE